MTLTPKTQGEGGDTSYAFFFLYFKLAEAWEPSFSRLERK